MDVTNGIWLEHSSILSMKILRSEQLLLIRKLLCISNLYPIITQRKKLANTDKQWVSVDSKLWIM